MKRFIALLAFAGIAGAGNLDLVRIDVGNAAAVKRLDRMGVIINQVHPDHIVAEIPKELRQILAERGFAVSVMRENITAAYRDNVFRESSGGKYLTYEQYRDTMVFLANAHPDIARLDTLGYSHKDRLLLIMKISDSVRLDQMEPEVHFDGNIHGDEKIGWGVCYSMVKYLLNNYSSDADVRRLVDNREIWIAPLYNPDGYVAATRGNGRGVDLNRNWGWMWGNEDACGADFISENENRRFIEHFWRHPFVTYVSFHSGTKYISEPWSYATQVQPPEQNLIRHLSKGYAAFTKYPYNQGSIGMYPLNGGSKDYNYGCGGVMGWSVEVCNEKTPAADQIDVIFVNERPAMTYLVHKAGQGIHGIIYDSIAGKQAGLRAMLYVNPAKWHSYSNAINGDFHRFYLPGTYGVTALCPGYDPKTIASVTVPGTGDSSVYIEFGLVRNATLPVYATRVIGSRFVAQTNKTYPVKALGPHDGEAFQVDAGKWIVLCLDYPIYNVTGKDFTVYRSSGSGAATVKVSNDWSGSWQTAGTAGAAADSFDIASTSLDSARYVRIEATSQFLLDAVEAPQGKISTAAHYAAHPAPGPAHGIIAPAVLRKGQPVRLDGRPPENLWVFDMRGHAVAALPAAERQRGIRIPDLPSGVYHLMAPGMKRGIRIVLVD